MNDRIEIILGEATASHARLYVRATENAGQGDALQVTGLTGSMTGPQCRYARTLPTCYSLRPLETSADLLAELVVPDPCFWTPQMPLLYRLDMRLQGMAGETQVISQLVGIRRWGVDRAALRLEGRRTVLRGVETGPGYLTRQQLATAHDEQLTLIMHQVDDAFCEEASRVGVALVADLRGTGDAAAMARELVRASRWPAVLLAVVEESRVISTQSLPAGLPVLHPLDISSGKVASKIASWADGVLVEMVNSDRLPDWLATLDKPVLAIRRDQQDVCLATVRRTCDRLQSDLAPQFDLAGYFIGSLPVSRLQGT
jgi:hypothetical protein